MGQTRGHCDLDLRPPQVEFMANLIKFTQGVPEIHVRGLFVIISFLIEGPVRHECTGFFPGLGQG